jgi:pyruvate formate lyase activating enzyme
MSIVANPAEANETNLDLEYLKATRGVVTNIQRFCVHDGPGIRTVVFLKGCPLRCRWCSNPETQAREKEILKSKSKCLLCGRCIQVCPRGALSLGEGEIVLNRALCRSCGKCAAICFAGALEVVGELKKADEVMREVMRDLAVFRQSGGGITLSGGEPTYQPEFALALLKLAKNRDIHTAIETCGYTSWENLVRLLPYCDLFLYDLKHLNDGQHRLGTGQSNKLILENLRKLCAHHTDVVVRVPVIPEFNYNYDTLLGMARYAWEAGARTINLLPYHRLGRCKYENLGRVYTQPDLEVDEAELKEWCAQIEKLGISATVGG